MRAETGIGEVRNCPSPTYCNSPSAETATVKRKLIVVRIVLDLPRPMQVVISARTIAADAAFGHDLARLATEGSRPRPRIATGNCRQTCAPNFSQTDATVNFANDDGNAGIEP